jgi:hypothetical protein
MSRTGNKRHSINENLLFINLNNSRNNCIASQSGWARSFSTFPCMHPIKQLALKINHRSHWAANRIHSLTLCYSSELIRWVISACDRISLNASISYAIFRVRFDVSTAILYLLLYVNFMIIYHGMLIFSLWRSVTKNPQKAVRNHE